MAEPGGSMAVVLPTRDRGATPAAAVRSILSAGGPLSELVVIDQSRDNRTSAALAPFLDDPRVTVLRSRTVGLARARNEAIAACRSELVAMTDDDCVATSGWLAALADVFASDDRVGLVFGSVLPADHDPRLGFLPVYTVRARRLDRGRDPRQRIDGIGACMAVRRLTWAEIGGFDELLGAGARFQAADEGDFALRALAAGWYVGETPDGAVVHLGFRPWKEAEDLVRGYARGTGAMMAKHVRRRSGGAPRLLSRMAWSWVRGRTHEAARLGGAPYRWMRLRAFTAGFAEGLRLPVDPATCRYEPSATAVEPVGAG
ncbi:MAG: glycosyltransferase family 2 protein [Gemmatimonadota bacterium]